MFVPGDGKTWSQRHRQRLIYVTSHLPKSFIDFNVFARHPFSGTVKNLQFSISNEIGQRVDVLSLIRDDNNIIIPCLLERTEDGTLT